MNMQLPLHDPDAVLILQFEAAIAFLRSRSASEAQPAAVPGEHAMRGDALIGKAARDMYKARLHRGRFFTALADDFGEPLWDLILDLFIAQRGGSRVPVSTAANAANVAPTTALRWIALLEAKDIVTRESDPNDRRRSWLRLNQHAYEQMERYIGDCLVRSATAQLEALKLPKSDGR